MANSTALKYWLENDNPRRYFDTVEEAANYAENVSVNTPWLFSDPNGYVILSGSVVTLSD